MIAGVNEDPHRLHRFLEAQSDTYDAALAELTAGRKRSHWMWFVLPQLEALGRSPTARHFGIRSADEARAYLAHPVLGSRLRECVDAMLGWAALRTAVEILGEVDAIKFRSCLTLFAVVSGEARFGQALDAFYGGERDPATLDLLGR